MRRLRPGVGIGRFPRLIVEVFFSRTQTGSRLDRRLYTTEQTEKSTAKPRIPRRKRLGQGNFMHLMPVTAMKESRLSQASPYLAFRTQMFVKVDGLATSSIARALTDYYLESRWRFLS